MKYGGLKVDYGKWFFGVCDRERGDARWIHIVASHKSVRHLGYFEDWYDGPMHFLGFWFFHVTWRWF